GPDREGRGHRGGPAAEAGELHRLRPREGRAGDRDDRARSRVADVADRRAHLQRQGGHGRGADRGGARARDDRAGHDELQPVGLAVEPPAFVTVTGPETAAEGTTAVSVVAFTTLNEVALTPGVNLTAVVPVNVLPVSVTVAPAVDDSGAVAIVGRIGRFDGV